MTEYTDAELADMCEQAADLLKDNAYPDTCESIQIAAARLRTRSEDTERFKAQVAELQASRDREYLRMLEWRGIDADSGDVVCGRCSGFGVAAYAGTNTWLGGIGGQMITSAICDQCWGSGKSNAPWLNLRKLPRAAIDSARKRGK